MTRPANQPAQRVDLRATMPETAKWVDDQRAAMGVDHVNGCIRRAMKGEPGFFYAMEAGRFLGTPFPDTHPIYRDQHMAVTIGCQFAAFIAMPSQAVAA